MVRSAPQVSFSVTSINYGTIDVGGSATTQYYDVYMPQRSNTMTEAIHMSISFKEGTNASEASHGSWVWVSTTGTPTSVHIGSVSTGPEASIGSIVAGRIAGAVSVHVGTNIVVPAAAATAGAVTFYLHHRILAVIRRGCGSISTLVTTTIKALNWIAGIQLSLPPFSPLIVH